MTDKTLITLGPSLKVALLLGLISEWSQRDKIEALHATLMAVTKVKANAEHDAWRRFKEDILKGK